jgi:hypothetical protein
VVAAGVAGVVKLAGVQLDSMATFLEKVAESMKEYNYWKKDF